LKRELGVDATLEVGGSGEFTVWVDGKQVLAKSGWRFPGPDDVVAAVKTASAK
jgi:hypothetical protein